MSAIQTFNVEAGLPTLDEARRTVAEQIRRAKRQGTKMLKVIHGYGSSGRGGALCIGLRKSFGLRKKEGVIRDFIAGEDFSIFNDTVLALLEAVPGLRCDPDLGATNEGVTIL
ncbi:MAG: Smr/MutS family protein [Verrucomicrobia bacterium]|nr:Smr/MutS family protein [Verrucomicrobiota bacterium]